MKEVRKNRIKLAVIFISLTQGLQYSVSPVLGLIQDSYPQVSVDLIQMLVTVSAFLSMIVALFSGWLVTKLSKKKILLFGAFTTGLCGFLPLLADSFSLLFASRALTGIGIGTATALSTAVIAEHFEGRERAAVMGLQGASVGAGMLLATTLGGILGAVDYRGAYFVHIIGFVSTIVIALMLPDTGRTELGGTQKLRLNRKVAGICFLGFYEFLFLITFTTNIAMHLGGSLEGNATVSGTLTGIFSGIQIIAGLVFGYVCRVTKEQTLPVAMLFYAAGSLLLIFFPGSFSMLVAGALCCGFSQGIFIPRAMLEVAGAVELHAAALASAALTVCMCMAQMVSPKVLNTASRLLFGNVSTTNVYLICLAAMTVLPVCVIMRSVRKK